MKMRSLAKTLLIYTSYWYQIGPAFGLSLQLYINYRFGLVLLIDNATYPDTICILSCIILAAYIAVSFFVKIRTWRNQIIIASTFCGVLAMWGMETSAQYGLSSGIWALLSMFLFSIFLMSHLLIWVKVFVYYDKTINLIYVLLLTMLAGIFCWFLLGLQGSRLLSALIVMVIMSGAILGKSMSSTAELKSPHPTSTVLRPPMIGILAVSFFFGLGFMYTTSVISLEDFHNNFGWTVFLYALVLCAIVLVLSNKVRISSLFYIAAPITISGILLALFNNPFSALSSAFCNIGFFTYLVFVLVLYCAVYREYNSEPTRASALLIICLYLGIFCGRHLFSLINALVEASVASYLHAALSVLIVVLLLVCTMIGLRIINRIVSNELARPQFRHINTFESNEYSSRIALIYNLSEREREVLQCVLEGKSATKIAEDLYIAHGTIKAHINNIYKKLNIHTREELFTMIPKPSE